MPAHLRGQRAAFQNDHVALRCFAVIAGEKAVPGWTLSWTRLPALPFRVRMFCRPINVERTSAP